MKSKNSLTRRQFIDLAAGAAAALGPNRRLARAFESNSPHVPQHVRFLDTGSPIREPYKPLHGGDFRGSPIPQSPDPLVGYRWASPQAGDDLQIYVLLPVTAHTETPQSFKEANPANPGAMIVEGPGSIRFDFGVESAAWLEFDSPDLTGSVEMSISEYNEPAIVNSGPPHPIKTLAPKRYGNTYRLELNPQMYEGVRFGWIHVRQFEKPWHITAVRVVCQAKPANYHGSFSCSDEMLTRIWYTGAYVVRVNFQKDYFGAVLMDRGDRYSWTGDAHVAQAVAMVAFANWDFVKQNLDRTAKDSNSIESYSLYWILSLLDYYQSTGDQQVLIHYIPLTISKLEHASRIYDAPPITFYGSDERLGADFENPNRFESKSAYRMLYVHCCRVFASAMSRIGRADLSTKYRNIALGKMKALKTNTQWFSPFGIHALADTVNTGLVSPADRDFIFAQSFSDRLNRLSFSPFNEYFILQAMAGMNRHEEALETIRDLWGGQIEYGATTFFEVYNPSWNRCITANGAVPNCQTGYTSLAHPWSGGVTVWLSREILGVKPVAPGFSRVEITPRLGSSLAWVAGSVPTPHGTIDVRFNRSSGRGSITIPPNTVGRIGFENGKSSIRRLSVNGALTWDGDFHRSTGIGGAAVEKSILYLEDVQPGSYTISVLYDREPATTERPPLMYPRPGASVDVGTSGNWGGVYGADGFVLFDYDGVGKDRSHLPPYIMSVRPSTTHPGTSFHAQVTDRTEEQRALAGSRKNARTRKVGQLYTGAPAACQETMTIDIAADHGKAYRASLYFLDWERAGRRQAIEVFDLNTLTRMAPVHTVEDFAEGKYLTYSCEGSVRFRIDQIRGPNAVLNAVFFDPA